MAIEPEPQLLFEVVDEFGNLLRAHHQLGIITLPLTEGANTATFTLTRTTKALLLTGLSEIHFNIFLPES